MDVEQSLIRRIQKTGSSADADMLIRKYYDEIYIFVYRQTSHKETAMDLTQEIFISMLKSIGRYDGRLSGFRTWLYRIATNKTIDYLRGLSARYVPIDVNELDIPDEKELASQFEAKDMVCRLQNCVNKMDTDTQKIFRLKFFGGYTFLQIAEIITVSESTVKSKYYRMLKKLREEYGDEYTHAR